MVCLGNICRSPLADGLLRDKINTLKLNVIVDSAGTSGHHIGESPDNRMTAKALEYKHDISNLRSRQFSAIDFENFDLIYAMDKSNYQNIIALARSSSDIDKVKMILDESHPGEKMEVPDPYYGGEQGFENVYRLIDKATDCIIKKLK